jgi:hypothetical protein
MAITFDGSQSASYFKQNPDVAAAFQQDSKGMTPNEFTAWHYSNFGQKEGRQLPQSFRTMSTTQGQPKGMLGTFNSDTGNVTYGAMPNTTTPVSGAQQQQWQRDAANQDMYQNSANWSDYLEMKRNSELQYKDLAKQVMGDDFDAWEAARLGRNYFVRKDPDSGRLTSYKTGDYLNNKFGTADYNAYMGTLGIPQLPNVVGSSTQGYSAYKNYLDTLGTWAAGKNLTPQQGMFQWYDRNPNQANFPTSATTSLSGQVVNPNPRALTGSSAPQMQNRYSPLSGPLAGSVGASTGSGGLFPTVTDSSAWKAAPTAATPFQRREGLFK